MVLWFIAWLSYSYIIVFTMYFKENYIVVMVNVQKHGITIVFWTFYVSVRLYTADLKHCLSIDANKGGLASLVSVVASSCGQLLWFWWFEHLSGRDIPAHYHQKDICW